MKIENIEVKIIVSYEKVYIHGIPYHTTGARNFFIDEEKYKKLLNILEEE